jgi:hypothetical protein
MQSVAKHLTRFVGLLTLTSAREMLRYALHDETKCRTLKNKWLARRAAVNQPHA